MNIRIACIAAAVILAAAYCAGASGRTEENLSLQGIESISIQAGALDVDVFARDSSTVSMSADIPQDSLFLHRDFNVVHQQTGSRLKVWIETTRVFGSIGPGKLTLYVPPDVDMRVQTVSGIVSIQGLRGSSCAAITASGDITVRDLSGPLAVQTVSGRITLDSLQGGLDARSVSGRIRGTHVLLTSDSEISTVSGDVVMRLDSDLEDLRFDLTSLSGTIRVGTVKTHRGLHMGFGEIQVKGHTVSGSILFQ
jgi:DUF4097 and DUF4098 domain-containing protein YvlB